MACVPWDARRASVARCPCHCFAFQFFFPVLSEGRASSRYSEAFEPWLEACSNLEASACETLARLKKRVPGEKISALPALVRFTVFSIAKALLPASTFASASRLLEQQKSDYTCTLLLLPAAKATRARLHAAAVPSN